MKIALSIAGTDPRGGTGIQADLKAMTINGVFAMSAIQRSKDYLSGALGAMLDLGKGRGPMQHNFDLTGEFAKETE